MQSRGVRRPSVCLSVCPSVNFAQIVTSTTEVAGSLPNLHTMVPRRARIQGVLKVKVKGHVIRTILWFHENPLFSQANGWIATKLAHDGPHMGLHPRYAQGQGRRSRDTGTSVMSRNVYYTVPSDVLSLHALTLRSTVTLSFQYMCQTARCNVYIMEWATPSLTVWFCECHCQTGGETKLEIALQELSFVNSPPSLQFWTLIFNICILSVILSSARALCHFYLLSG